MILSVFVSGLMSLTRKRGINNLKRMPSQESSINLPTKPLQIFAQASSKSDEAFYQSFVLGELQQLATSDSGVGKQEFRSSQDEPQASLVALEKSQLILVGARWQKTSCVSSGDERRITLVLDWDTCRVR